VNALHEAVLATATRVPDAPAITSGAVTLTYRRLIERAGGLAIRLRAAGVASESLIAVVVDQTADTLVAFLGVLLTGSVRFPPNSGQVFKQLSLCLSGTARNTQD
jgi:non-ribosomal peptide synthetase component F